MLPNKLYDILKWVAQIVLPALGACYFGLSQIWGLPYGEEAVGTITVLDAFLGALLGVSTAQYKQKQEDKRLERSLASLFEEDDGK